MSTVIRLIHTLDSLARRRNKTLQRGASSIRETRLDRQIQDLRDSLIIEYGYADDYGPDQDQVWPPNPDHEEDGRESHAA